MENYEEHQAVVVLQDLVSVFSKPKGGVLGCQLRKGVYVPVLGRKTLDGVTWIHIPPGWLCSIDAENKDTVELVQDLSLAFQSWDEEASKRKRMASAIASELVKSHPLPKVKRFVNSLWKHADKYYPDKPMIKINKIGMEDIMISLGGKMGLTKQQIFEYIKVTASQHSNPPQSVLDIVAEIRHLTTFRPTQWVAYDLNVLETEDVRRKNDQFVMLAASGKLAEFKQMVEGGHELTSLHSELKYTALHGAADFGQTAVVDYIITTGVSLDMKDPRKLQTALHVAAYNGRQGVIKSLLAANADRTIGDRHGITPYMYAEMQGLHDCRDLLKFLPPTITDLTVVDHTISSVTVTWKCPKINPVLHAEITEFYLECLPEDITKEEESYITPYPATPAIQKPTFMEEGENNRTHGLARIDYMYQKYLDIAICQVMFSNLTPSMTYRIRGKCCSLSGWSQFCLPVVQKTLAYVPSAPEPVDICKISANGLLLSWRPPLRDNGAAVEFYQIEMIDAKMAVPVIETEQRESEKVTQNINMTVTGQTSRNNIHHGVSFSTEMPPESGNEGSPIKTAAAALPHKSTNINPQTKRLPSSSSGGSGGAKTSVASRFHRLIRHKNLNFLHKYLTGLELGRPYQCRVRAHNALGYSPWSGWTGPIAPAVAVTISKFTPERLSATLTWFTPILSVPTRKVEAYEFQMCCLRGPLTKSIDLLTSEVSAHLRTGDNYRNNKNDKNQENSANGTPSGNRKRSNSESSEESEDPLAWRPLSLDGEEIPDYSKTNKIVTSKVMKEDESNEFITLRSDLTENVYEVTGLKAGSRYRCRVRCKINDYPHWNPWDFSVLSEIFSMPATPPDPPFMVRVAVGRSYFNASTTAALVAHEANQAALAETGEYLPRGSVPFRTTQPSTVESGCAAVLALPEEPPQPETILDFSFADLMKLGEEEDAKMKAAQEAEALRLEELAENGHSADAVSSPTEDGMNSLILALSTAEGEDDEHDHLTALFQSSVKIKEKFSERVSEKISTSLTSPSAKQGTTANSPSIIPSPLYAESNSVVGVVGSGGNDLAAFPADRDCDVEDGFSAADSRSMSVVVQSVTSAEMARFTDVDIKSGKYIPGIVQSAPTSQVLPGPSQSCTISTTAPQQLSTNEDEAPLAITHNSITISWQNGQANGLPVEEFVVEMARVREYRLIDVVRAKEAYQNIVETDEIHDLDEFSHDGSVASKNQMFKPAHTQPSQSPERDALAENSESCEEDCWHWKDITHTSGTFIGFQKFRAENLIPGGTYIFRVKQRNSCGWSLFSAASRMIATYPSVPPGQPTVFAVRSSYVAIRWAESEHAAATTTTTAVEPRASLTNLEYEVQIGVIPNTLHVEGDAPAQAPAAREIDTVWESIEVRFFPSSDALLQQILLENNAGSGPSKGRAAVHTTATQLRANRSSGDKSKTSNNSNNSNSSNISAEHRAESNYVHVMLDQLVSQVTYVLRVRVRTVVGWSPWSAVSEPFRTQAL